MDETRNVLSGLNTILHALTIIKRGGMLQNKGVQRGVEVSM
jgi:hypothetical protein